MPSLSCQSSGSNICHIPAWPIHFSSDMQGSLWPMISANDKSSYLFFGSKLYLLKLKIKEPLVAILVYIRIWPSLYIRIKTHGGESQGQGGSTLRRPLDERT